MLKWRITCKTCGSISELGKANATVFHYTRQSYFDHLECYCLYCQTKILIWKIDAQDVDIAALEGFLVETEFAPDEVIRRHNKFIGIDDNVRELTPRQERRIAFEMYLLDRELDELDATG